ncbi:type I-B CRISPR-associated endonuclease Cas1b [Bacillus solimangrovi]|uniref:CRISPR-associated endonuclease Cas1 n=1 Tax=Bacillus solimangrovi TaxID=1305675 RepID=A0A1E5LG18_9BACI|nr:type I-B CRISPR-associated endonuclease Cas1b [Bacillus solimangrovi]OEH93025.1 subtype I-B CRISPR-associated endonuclease Cas1 [Bacillus solimangrovi]
MMRDHYIFSNGRMKRKHNTIYFQNDKEEQTALPIEKLRNLHIFGEVDFNTKLLNYLSQYDICLHIYNYYGFYAGTFYPKEKQKSGLVIVQQSNHYSDHDKRMYLAESMLQGAVHHMLRNLRRHKEHLSETISKIEQEAQKLKESKTIPELMGTEGRIRKHYYQAFNVMIKQDFVFEKREKKPPRDPINALISFGNMMMYRAVLSEIYRTALNPTISFLHEPSTKRFSLSLDLAEIFKPLIIDPLIVSLINKRSISNKHFDYLEGEVCYLNEEGKKQFITAFEKRMKTTVMHRGLKRKTSYRLLIRLECYKLIKHVIDDEEYKPLKAWW